MNETSRAEQAFGLPRVAFVAIPATWTAALFVVFAQNVILGWLGRPALPPASVLPTHLPYAIAWAAASPLIMLAARRWPVTGTAWRRNVLIHLMMGCAFILLVNALLRAPLLDRPALWARDLAAGLATFGPGALLAWSVIVAIGHGLPAPAPASAGETGLLARSGSRLTIIPPAEIEWVDAASNYVRVRTVGKTWLLRQPLGEIESQLPSDEFVRIHRSTIVAVRAIRQIRPRTHGDAEVILSDGSAFRVPRTRRQAVAAALETTGSAV